MGIAGQFACAYPPRQPVPPAPGSQHEAYAMSFENIVIVVVIVLIVLFVLGYFGRGRMGR
jgi:hypothetical protein